MTNFTQIKTLLLMCLFTLLGTTAMADEVTYDFSTTIPSVWTASQQPLAFETASPTRGAQFTSSTKLTLSGVSNVTKVVITCSCNIADGNTLALSVGGKTWGTESLAKENNVEKTFTGTAASGDIVIDITRTSKSVWIKKIVVTGTAPDGGSTGGDTPVEETLDPDYKYAEPTIITPTGDLSNNTAYSFVQNNIKVSATVGGRTASYFGCNAGQSITFTATKPIKAIVIDGFVKQNFDCEASSGDVYGYDTSEGDVEESPVLAILDIDAKELKLTCVKQLRCYKVYVYFEENPDISGGGEGGDDEYNFDYEPTTASTINVTFDEIEITDYTSQLGYPCTDIFLSNDDYEAEIVVFASVGSDGVIAEGEYPINDTYEENTVQASPGGDDNYDYPTMLCTDFEYYEAYEAWYYNTTYYIESGTVTVAKSEGGYQITLNGKSHYGSTITGTYTNGDFVSVNSLQTAKPSLKKYIKNGKMFINTGDKEFNANGVEVK